MKIKSYIILGLFLLVPVFLSAQTAAELELILDSPAVLYSQAAWFATASVGSDASTENEIPPEAAFQEAMAKGWLPKNAAANEPITLGGLSLLMMKAFGIKGGLMYTIAPGPRYAFRSMVSRSLIPGAADPAMKVSGERFLIILGNVLNVAGGEE